MNWRSNILQPFYLYKLWNDGVHLHLQFAFCIVALHWHVASDIFTSWVSELRKEREKKEGKHFFVACVMIVKWHVASLQFLDARVWNGWYFPHEKYYWLQLKKHSRWNSPDGASLHGCGYGHGFVDVIGEYGSNQTVICVVGSFNHFLNSFELHDLLHWSKNLSKKTGHYRSCIKRCIKTLSTMSFHISIHVLVELPLSKSLSNILVPPLWWSACRPSH